MVSAPSPPPASRTARSLPPPSRAPLFPQVWAPQTEAGDAARCVLTRLLCPLSSAIATQVWDLRSVTVQVAAAVIATLVRALGLAYADAAADRLLPALLGGAGATVAVIASAVVSAATVLLKAGGVVVPPSAMAALAAGLAHRRGTLLATRRGRRGGTVVIGGLGAGGAKRGWPDADDVGVAVVAAVVTVTAAAVAAAAVPTADDRLPWRLVVVRRGAATAADGPSGARRPPPHARPGLAEMHQSASFHAPQPVRIVFRERNKLQQGHGGCQSARNRIVYHVYPAESGSISGLTRLLSRALRLQ